MQDPVVVRKVIDELLNNDVLAAMKKTEVLQSEMLSPSQVQISYVASKVAEEVNNCILVKTEDKIKVNLNLAALT